MTRFRLMQTLVIAGVGALALVAGSPPAHADRDWRWGHHDGWHDRRWREPYRPWAYAPPPGVYYNPPPAYYAPPPAVSFGLNFGIP